MNNQKCALSFNRHIVVNISIYFKTVKKHKQLICSLNMKKTYTNKKFQNFNIIEIFV